MYRQGDLLFVRPPSGIPAGTTVVPDGVIKEGESTGHAHRVDTAVAEVSRLPSGLTYILAPEGGVDVTHEEHDTITLPSGEWIVIEQREYSPRGWGWTAVAD